LSHDIRYIVLSDVHLGAQNSILTSLEKDTTVADTHVPSPALVALIECLRRLVNANEGTLPTLVADGDLVDLALSTPSRALPVFGQFVEALTADGDPVVADEMILLPGNHDHIIWEYTRERWLEDQLTPDTLEHLLQVSARRTGPLLIDAQPRIESTLLTALMRAWSGREGATMRVAYPDLAVPSADGKRLVLITHGHYVDPVSTVMSAFLRLVAPQVPPPADVETMERENWPWVDFFFSSMTRSGKPGALVENIYDALQDPKALGRLVDVVARNVTHGKGKAAGKAERWLIDSVIGSLLVKVARSRDRGVTTELLGADARGALQTYVAALRARVVESLEILPGDVSLIIGHTHKPFRQWWPDETWPQGGLRLFNTGGWVVDHVAPQPLAGGALALVSDDLDVALVRMYQQIDDPSAWRISVDTVEPGPGGEAFAKRIRDLVVPDQPPWSTFSTAAAELVLERRREMALIVEGKLSPLRDD
jgi:UDP-2,3-diacylglucosamine pyrophosphatase LpxH